MFAQNNIKAVNGADPGPGYTDYSVCARRFWLKVREKKQFFIDCCTAYSWNPMQPAYSGFGGSPGNRYTSHTLNDGLHYVYAIDGQPAGSAADSIAPFANQFGWQNLGHPGNFWSGYYIRQLDPRGPISGTNGDYTSNWQWNQGDDFSSRGRVSNGVWGIHGPNFWTKSLIL